ncbi:MAG: alanine racemase [Rhizobiales bacterium]|nr:alanine racemase [Hyphomicrobiales bacterium]
MSEGELSASGHSSPLGMTSAAPDGGTTGRNVPYRMSATTGRELATVLAGLPAHAPAAIVIDRGALVANHRYLAALAPRTEIAPVVKADGYGIGVAEVARVLAGEGARTFFVATLEEAIALRRHLHAVLGPARRADIHVLDGLLPGSGEAFREHGLRPVLSSPGEVEEWLSCCRRWASLEPAALHVDTGMTRLGLMPSEALAAAAEGALKPALLMSHFACADEPSHPLNGDQSRRFASVRSAFAGVPASLANSAGLLAHPASHLDVARPGYALYGGKAVAPSVGLGTMAPVVHVFARIARLLETDEPVCVGYGAAQSVQPRRVLATVTFGYADGLLRGAGSSNQRDGHAVHVAGHRAPLVGRISMDLLVADVSAVPRALCQRGAWVEIVGQHATIDDLANHAGTIGYEFLTRLSRRIPRVWIGGGTTGAQEALHGSPPAPEV